MIAKAPPESPKRVQLGIDKGVKATDVSLGRARSTNDISSASNSRDQRHRKPLEKISSFSERAAQLREADGAKSLKYQRSQEVRSKGFGVKRTQPTPNDHDVDARPEKPTTDDIPADLDEYSKLHLSRRLLDRKVLDEAFDSKVIYSIPRLLKEVVAPDYDPPDIEDDYVVLGVIASKSTPRNHAPTHHTTASADTGDTSSAGGSQRSKFMVLRLTDLQWEIDLFLFGTGFDTFYKLTVGTVIAILNPGIMPPKPHMKDSGRFSLKLGSSDDTVVEIGTAKDLGFCKSIKKDGKQCDSWVNLEKTEYCDFHVNLQVERTRAGRMEINSMSSFDMFKRPASGAAGAGRGGRGRGGSGNATGRGGGGGQRGPRSMGNGAYYDREAHSSAFAIPAHLQHGSSAAKMLDAEDYAAHGGATAAERSRKRLAAQQKERDLARKLVAQGSGLGKEYMQSGRLAEQKSAGATRGQRQEEDAAPDAQSLGLVGSSSVSLGPSPGGAVTKPRTSRSDGVGWSSAFKRGLPSPTRGLSPNRKESSPKKARFQIEGKGVRVPGRRSLPGAGDCDRDGGGSSSVKAGAAPEDDDGELDIV